MGNEYFSEKELGAKGRVIDTISIDVWQGLRGIIQASIERGDFGEEFPDFCQDGQGNIIGTNIKAMGQALKAEIPDAVWPLAEDEVPEVFVILDLVEFCYRHVAQSSKESEHGFFRHHHLEFDKAPGQRVFRERINTIFRRNGIAFDLGTDGAITRLASPVLREVLESTLFRTGDGTLDQMINEARQKFMSPDSKVRRESLERLWDVWERVKMLHDPTDKKRSMASLLPTAAPEPKFRARLDAEAKELTDIGNNFLIRHSETTQTPLQRDEHVDYLFHRLFALIHMFLSIEGKARPMTPSTQPKKSFED